MANKKTPARARAAILDGPLKVGAVEVRPITLAVYAVLEEAGSYLFDEKPRKLKAIDRLPTLYVCTRPAAESMAALRGGGIKALQAAAAEWADGVPAADLGRIVRAVRDAADRVSAVVPSGDGEDAGNG